MTEREKFEKWLLIKAGTTVEFNDENEAYSFSGDSEGEHVANAIVAAAWDAWQAAISSFTLPERMDYDLEGDTVINSHYNTWADGYNQCLSDVISMNEEYSESAAPEVK